MQPKRSIAKKKKGKKSMSRKRMVVLAVLASAALIVGLWYATKSREVKVWVYTDYAFRQSHAEWSGLIEARFNEVNRIYQRNGTGVRWKVLDSSQVDPTSNSQGIDRRRADMALHFDRPTDVFVVLTGVQQGTRTGSVSPFTRVAVVVDYPNKSETVNARLLAHELAHLFGAPHDPAWLDTLMNEKPESSNFSERTVAVIRRMRNYPFDLGIDALKDSGWEKTALAAVAGDDVAAHSNAAAHAQTVVGTSLINERKTVQALAHFRAAAAADPQNKTMHLNLAEAYTRDGQFVKAIAEAREAVRLAPDDPLAHRALGALLGRSQQPEAALQELQTAVRLQPNNPQNEVLLGIEYASTFGHLDDAVSTLQNAAQADPDLTVARTSLAQAENLKERVQEVIAKERAIVHDHPDDADAHFRLAKAEARAGDLKSAIADMQKAAELRPDRTSTHTGLAELYIAQGDMDAAWAEVRKLRAMGSEPPSALLARLPAQSPAQK